jgi:endoglucanase
MRWRTVALASGAVVVLGGAAAAATLIPDSDPHDVSGIVSAPAPAATPSPSTPFSPAPAPNPLAGAAFYVDPDSLALQAAARSSGQQRTALMRIGTTPQAFWYGDWVPTDQLTSAVNHVASAAADKGQVPILVTYDIPVRDYRSWIDRFAAGIAGRQAVVILEPDALAQLDCLSPTDQQTRLALLRYAVHALTNNHKTVVYLDAGHANWVPAATMAERLRNAGVHDARGFSLNVSNFDRTTDEVAYGHAVAAALGVRTPFVIDTSRNGAGPAPDNAWCNPPNRALGAAPTTQPNQEDVDAFLWIKRPGESDGTCNGGPAAGQFWTNYAIGLAERSSSAS